MPILKVETLPSVSYTISVMFASTIAESIEWSLLIEPTEFDETISLPSFVHFFVPYVTLPDASIIAPTLT